MNNKKNISLKICGLKFSENIREIIRLEPDYMGFIFYPKSPRYVVEQLDPNVLANIPKTIQKVGVFVNEDLDKLLELARLYHLDMIQLHGNEKPEYCAKVGEQFPVIKAFSVDDGLDFEDLHPYMEVVDYFLFDTKTPLYGGSGQKFNWDLLMRYSMLKPYFLSGGIGVDDIEEILVKGFPGTFILDVNSKLEVEPGLKDLGMTRELTRRLRQKVV